MVSHNANLAGGLEQVLANDICSGCGVCAGLAPNLLEMKSTTYGTYRPVAKPQHTTEGSAGIPARVCPFSGEGSDEDSLGENCFGHDKAIRHSDELGFYLNSYAASLTDEGQRLSSSSGGLTTYVLQQMLTRGMVDAVLCVQPTGESGSLFEYTVARRPEDLNQCRKSRYYPVDLSRVLEEVLCTPGRYAVTALPCFAKGLRLAMQQNDVLRGRIHYIVGLFCGHLKTKQFASYLIRRCGFSELDVGQVDFRKKIPNLSAAHYAFEATRGSVNGAQTKNHVLMRDVPLGSWGLNAFMLKACECCDDVVGELADISMGDAWLPEFYRDGRGTNFVICRRPDLSRLLLEGAEKGELNVEEVPASSIVASQSAGFRQRRQALSYRLHLAQERGEWRPSKRVPPDRRILGVCDRLIQRLRIYIAESSKASFPSDHQAFQKIRFGLQVVLWRWINALLLKLRKVERVWSKR